MILTGIFYDACGVLPEIKVLFDAQQTTFNGVLRGSSCTITTQEDGSYYVELEPGYYEVKWIPKSGRTVRLGSIIADSDSEMTLPEALDSTETPITPSEAENYLQQMRDEADRAEAAADTAVAAEDGVALDATDAENHAQSLVPFTDQDGVQFDKGARGWSEDSADDASDAELQAQSETSFTDSSGDAFDKGAKGWAGDAEAFRDEAETFRNEINATGVPTADRVVKSESDSQYINPGWMTPHTFLLADYEPIPDGCYDTGIRTAEGLKYVTNWELAQLYDYGEIDGSAADPDGESVFEYLGDTDGIGGSVGRFLDTSEFRFEGVNLSEDFTASRVGTGSAQDATYNEADNTWQIERVATGDQSYILITGLDLSLDYKMVLENDAGSDAPLYVRTTAGGIVLSAIDQGQQKTILPKVDEGTGSITITTGPGVSVFSLISFRSVGEKGLPFTQPNDTQQGKYAEAPANIRNLLSGTDALATQDVDVTAAEHTLSFKGTGSVTLSGVSTAGPLNGTGAEDIVSLTFTPTAGTLTLTVSGTVEDAQLELGDARTDYQSANADRTNITSATEPSFGQIRMDQVDDEYPITLANGLTSGTVIVAGRQGTWVEEGVTLSAGSTFTVGPTSVTGCPAGVLFAVGEDVVGWSVIDKAMSELEIRREVEYWKAKGAKGRLVEGPELLADPGFDDAGEWTAEADWTVSGGKATLPAGASGAGVYVRADISNTTYPVITSATIDQYNETSSYRLIGTVTGTSSGSSATVLDTRAPITSTTTRTQITNPGPLSGGQLRFSINGSPTNDVILDAVSIKQLIPEEDL